MPARVRAVETRRASRTIASTLSASASIDGTVMSARRLSKVVLRRADPRRLLLLRGHVVAAAAATGAGAGGAFDQLDVEAESLELFDQDVERLGEAGVEGVLALDDRFVHPGAALDV